MFLWQLRTICHVFVPVTLLRLDLLLCADLLRGEQNLLAAREPLRNADPEWIGPSLDIYAAGHNSSGAR